MQLLNRTLIRTRRGAVALALAMPALAVAVTAGPAQASGHVEGYVWAAQPATP